MSATETQAPPAAGTGPRKLEGRVALVTGGTRGIGAAICHSLATQGATVAAGYSSDKESAEGHLEAIEKADNGLNVTVNAVAPRFIATDMLKGVPDKVLDGVKKQIPFARLGRPEEIARVVHFLCADASSYITGQVWAVNGGMDM